MTISTVKDYSALDHPDVCAKIFHPRPEPGYGSTPYPDGDHLVPVEGNIHVGLKFHVGHADNANILFFHGNGEIAADYDDVGPHFDKIGANLIIADYRGYGRSGGQPSVTAMMNDCHVIFCYVEQWLKNNDLRGPLIVMGRSLGSASAYELAACHASRMGGLIIESGFAFAGPLLRLLGIDVDAIGFDEDTSFANLFKAATYQGPTLFIHAEFDQIIPYSDGKALHDVSPSERKRILMIPGADHNNILMQGWDDYFGAIEQFLSELA